MSVSPLSEENLRAIGLKGKFFDDSKSTKLNGESGNKNLQTKKSSSKCDSSDKDDSISFGEKLFRVKKIKGKKTVLLPYSDYKQALDKIDIQKWRQDSRLLQFSKMNAELNIKGYKLFSGEKLSMIFDCTPQMNFTILNNEEWHYKKNFNFYENLDELISSLDLICKIAVAKEAKKELGFITLYNDNNETFWYKISRGYSTAVYESLSSLETLMDLFGAYEKDESRIHSDTEKTYSEKIGKIYSELRKRL